MGQVGLRTELSGGAGARLLPLNSLVRDLPAAPSQLSAAFLRHPGRSAPRSAFQGNGRERRPRLAGEQQRAGPCVPPWLLRGQRAHERNLEMPRSEVVPS